MVEFINFIIVLDDLLFVVLKGIEAIKEGEHGFCEVLSLRDVNLNEKGQRYVIEDILSQFGKSVVCQVLKELRFLCQVSMMLKVIH